MCPSSQALMDKTVGGKVFAPREVRQLAPSERAAAVPDMFARVQGLGRIPYANLRRPKPLMDTVTQQLPPGQVCGLAICGRGREGAGMGGLIRPGVQLHIHCAQGGS